jgi:adenylate cyclase
MEFLNDFFSVMTEIIFDHEGMVDNFMGDCIMAVFGPPIHRGDNPKRAVTAAIKMQQAQIALNHSWKKEGKKTFDIGIGVHSGIVSRGNIGSPMLKKYTVIGSNVNIASRFCSLAGPREILISQDTESQLNQYFQLEKLSPVKVKNVSYPLTAYKVKYSALSN